VAGNRTHPNLGGHVLHYAARANEGAFTAFLKAARPFASLLFAFIVVCV